MEKRDELNLNLLHPAGEIPKKRYPYLFIFLSLAAGIFLISLSYAKISHSSPGQTANLAQPSRPGFFTQLKNFILSPDRKLKGETEDRINILLLGIGGEGHDGPFLTDTIILLSFKPSTNQAAMLSIPRDLLVYIPDYGYGKVNVLNALGETKEKGYGPVLAGQTIGEVLNQPIHYFVRVDFQAFEEMIDKAGGIKIYVERSFTDNFFPTDKHQIKTISFEKGWQEMDGRTALNFARSRHGNNGEGSDFMRSRRQQKILTTLKDKLFSSSMLFHPGRLQDILESLKQHVETNVELWEINHFYQLAKKFDYENMINQVLKEGENQPLLSSFYNDAEVLQPKNGDWGEIQRIARNIFTETPLAAELSPPTTPAKDKPIIEIQNGTWILGLAAKTKNELGQKGIIASALANAARRDFSQTAIYDLSGGRFKTETQLLQKELNAPVKETIPAGIKSNADILIIVGEDKK